MIEHFKKSLDNGEYVACLSMDLSKAFDCLPHCLTICKLYSYGVSREACTLIASYLRGRKQRIKLGNSRSEWVELLKGVPQGSILGPLIFNIFLNDIFYFVSNSDLYNYADDNCISVSHKDISVLSAQLENVLSLSIMIHYVAVCLYVFHTMFTNVALASDFICMLLLVFPFKHLLLCIYYITFTCVYYLCIYYIILPVCYISLCIYRFIYWKSVTSDHLVLMLLVLQCTD